MPSDPPEEGARAKTENPRHTRQKKKKKKEGGGGSRSEWKSESSKTQSSYKPRITPAR